jgi:hypothetical protein
MAGTLLGRSQEVDRTFEAVSPHPLSFEPREPRDLLEPVGFTQCWSLDQDLIAWPQAARAELDAHGMSCHPPITLQLSLTPSVADGCCYHGDIHGGLSLIRVRRRSGGAGTFRGTCLGHLVPQIILFS